MKKKLILMLVCIMVVLTGCGASTYVDNQTYNMSVFSWNRELIDNDPADVMAKLSDYHIDRVYQGLYPENFESEKTAELVSDLKGLGIETVYLAGDPDWNDENVVIEWTLDRLIAYNEGVGKRAKIETICYDAEFYSNYRADEEHFSAYVSMMEKVSSKAHDSGLHIIYCLPYWLPSLSENFFKQLIAQADEVSIMNYDVGHEADNLTDIYIWCTEAGVKVESVFETQLADGVGIMDNNTYYSKGKEAVIGAADALKDQFPDISIGYHHLTSLLDWD